MEPNQPIVPRKLVTGWVTEIIGVLVILLLAAQMFFLPPDRALDTAAAGGMMVTVFTAIGAFRRWKEGQRGKWSYGQTSVEFDGQAGTVNVVPTPGAAPVQVIGPGAPPAPPQT